MLLFTGIVTRLYRSYDMLFVTGVTDGNFRFFDFFLVRDKKYLSDFTVSSRSTEQGLFNVLVAPNERNNLPLLLGESLLLMNLIF